MTTYRFLLILVLLSTFAYSQSLTFDTSFSGDGIAENGFLEGSDKAPADVQEIGGNYYVSNGRTTYKVSGNGVGLAEFTSQTASTGEYATFLNVKYVDNYIYKLGFSEIMPGHKRIYLLKLDLDLNPVQGFGDNGIVRLNFGDSSEITDFVLDDDGNLYCSGTRGGVFYWQLKKMILFKVDAVNGQLITEFDPAGYKEYAYDDPSTSVVSGSEKGFIARYNGNFILAGRNNPPARLITVAIDSNGNILDSYGTNGYRLTVVGPSFNSAEVPQIQDIRVFEGKLVLNYTSNPNFATIWNTYIYNLDNDIITGIDTPYYFYNSIRLYDDGIYLTADSEISVTHPFVLAKFKYNGEVDTTFANGGIFSYDYDGNSTTKAMYKDLGGNIVFVGLASSGVASMKNVITARLTAGPLNVEDEAMANADLTVYPNPFQNTITIEAEQQILAMELYDLSGRKVATPSFSKNFNTVTADISSVAHSGVYMLKIIFGDMIVVKRIIKK